MSRVALADTIETVVFQAGATADGNGTTIGVTHNSIVVFQIEGNFNAEVFFEGSIDGTWFTPIQTTELTMGAVGYSGSRIGFYRASVVGLNYVRARVSGYVSGTVKVTGNLSSSIETDKFVSVSGSNRMEAKAVNVTTAGTRVRLADFPCRQITIIAKRGNTGYIYVGGSNVSSTVYGVELASKDRITIPVNNASQIYIDASVNGEGISYIAN